MVFISCDKETPETINNEVPEITTSSIKISEDINEDQTLSNIVEDPNKVDYLVTDLVKINEVLTIEPGVVIAFEANAGFNVDGIIDNGVLIAKGTKSESIVFTGSSKIKGFWRGIRIFTNDVRNEMDHVIVEYAGSDEIVPNIKNGVKAGIALYYQPTSFVGSLKISNSIIRENDGYGLAVERKCILRKFENNSFKNNSKASVIVTASSVGALDSESIYTGENGYDGVEIVGYADRLEQDTTWPSFDDGSSYMVSSTVEVKAKLTIEPGAIFEFEANQEMVFRQDQFGPNDGLLIASGTPSKPIVFTAIDKNPGYWKGLRFQSSVRNILDYCIVEYGGSDPIAGSYTCNIGLEKVSGYSPPKLSVSNSKIKNSSGCGIVVESPESIFSNNNNNF